MNLSDEERQRRIDSNKARKGSKLRPEITEEVKVAKQAAWAERKAQGLHTKRWYKNRGLEVPNAEMICEISVKTTKKER